jgi:5-methylthioribose kinase
MTSNALQPGQRFILRVDDPRGLHMYLIQRGHAKQDEALRLSRAGEGNMNCVVRVHLPSRSLIVKQARPWVEKYPSIPAPIERAASEARFYRFATSNPTLAGMMPRLLDYDENSSLLILEDLAPARTFAECYKGELSLRENQLDELARYTSALHGMTIPPHDRPAFRNEAMRRLNHEHIFDVPLRPDDAMAERLERITPGLHRASETLRSDRAFRERIEELGRRYLTQDGVALIHGDLFPGSLLCTKANQLRVIDPEFCFCGDPEFDIGVFYAHVLLSGHGQDMASLWLKMALEGTSHSRSLALQYAGVEILRRILGVAQLPVSLSLEAKRGLLEQSQKMVLAE